MNKKLLGLLVSSLTVYQLSTYDHIKLNNYIIEAIKCDNVTSLNNINKTLVQISQGNEDADLTETLNVLTYLKDKDTSLKKSFKNTLPHALFWTLVCMEYKGIKKIIETGGGCGFRIKGDFNSLEEMKAAPKEWYICNKDGNEKILTRADFYHVLKLSGLIAGGLWTILGLGHYIYKKHYYKNLINKITKTPHVIVLEKSFRPIKMVKA